LFVSIYLVRRDAVKPKKFGEWMTAGLEEWVNTHLLPYPEETRKEILRGVFLLIKRLEDKRRMKERAVLKTAREKALYDFDVAARGYENVHLFITYLELMEKKLKLECNLTMIRLRRGKR